MVQVAFVTLGAGGEGVSADALGQAWRSLWPKEEPIVPGKDEGGALAFPFMGATGMVGFMPAPIPWGDLEGPARCAWHWKEAVEVLQAHRTHLIVGVSGNAQSPLHHSVRLTLLTAAVCAAARDVTGVYWAAGTAVSPADRFIALAQDMTPEEFPLLAWLELRVFSNADGTRWSVFTTGLQALGHMEVEIRESSREPEALVSMVLDVGQYLLKWGPVLKDGDTLGGDEDERLQIHHAPSLWDREGTVLWLEV